MQADQKRTEFANSVTDRLITRGLIVFYSRSAKPLCAGSIPARASKLSPSKINTLNRLSSFPTSIHRRVFFALNRGQSAKIGLGWEGVGLKPDRTCTIIC